MSFNRFSCLVVFKNLQRDYWNHLSCGIFLSKHFNSNNSKFLKDFVPKSSHLFMKFEDNFLFFVVSSMCIYLLGEETRNSEFLVYVFLLGFNGVLLNASVQNYNSWSQIRGKWLLTHFFIQIVIKYLF